MHSDYRPGIETRPTAYAMSLASEVGCDGEWEDDEIKETLSCLQSKPFGKFELQRTKNYLYYFYGSLTDCDLKYLSTIIDQLVEKGQKWETFMWHYRPWKPIVDGSFLPSEASENKKESLSAFLPEHPNTLMKAGRFNKVNLIFDIYLTNRS